LNVSIEIQFPAMIIITKRPGQLGNSLFLFAHFIAFSIEKQRRIVNVSFYQYAGYFPATSGDNLHRFPTRKSLWANSWIRKQYYWILFYFERILSKLGLGNNLISLIELDWNERFQMDDEEKAKELLKPVVLIWGWGFRCNSYVLKNADVIRNFFKPFPTHIESIERFMLPAKKKYDLVIGVHIRHGDYVNFAGGKYFYSLPQYASAMANAAKLFAGKKIGFLVCSNAKLDAGAFNGFDMINPSGHELEDMYALSMCDYILGPPSTYSMWASFYGNTPLYVMKDPAYLFNEKDFELPGKWIIESTTMVTA
jgi:hypothetical protein